ncbi:hypothetical protein LguiB_032114 [Lonicera macranthoides]
MQFFYTLNATKFVSLPLCDLLHGQVMHTHRKFSEHPSAVGSLEETSGTAKAQSSTNSAAPAREVGFRCGAGEEGSGVDGIGVVNRKMRGSRRQHGGKNRIEVR